jgi:hypothetical protein
MINNVLHSRLLRRLRRPVARFHTKLLGVLGVQSLPETPNFVASPPAMRPMSAEKLTQNVEADVPLGQHQVAQVSRPESTRVGRACIHAV